MTIVSSEIRDSVLNSNTQAWRPYPEEVYLEKRTSSITVVAESVEHPYLVAELEDYIQLQCKRIKLLVKSLTVFVDNQCPYGNYSTARSVTILQILQF